MAERAPVSAEDTLVRYDNPVLVTKQPEKIVSICWKKYSFCKALFKNVFVSYRFSSFNNQYYV